MLHQVLIVACKLLVVAYGIQFPNQGLNRVPLIGNMESQLLDHQGSPACFLMSDLNGDVEGSLSGD